MKIKGVSAVNRNYELEGIVTDLEILPIPRGRDTAQMMITVESGKSMLVPAPNFVRGEDDEMVAVEGGTFDFPISFDIGEPIAIRSVLVPAVNKNTGEVWNSKRYLMADPDKGPVDLEHTMTREEYLETDYPGKPE